MTIYAIMVTCSVVSVIATIAINIITDVRESRKKRKDVDKVETMELPRLKNCPFCGGEAKLHTFATYECVAYIKCQTCEVKTREVIDKNEDGKYILNAIEIWNTRKETKE